MTAHSVGGPAFEDLTARARIRDAALRMFAERGIDGATIRDIAKAAGVSAGLVRHHFGSKEALRDVCDTYALERVMRIKEQLVFEDGSADPGFLPTVHPTMLLMMRYFARSMVDGSAAAAALFDHMVELTEQWLAQHQPDLKTDLRAFSAVLVAMQTGPLVMHDHLSRALGADVLSPEGHIRMGRATVDFYATNLLTPELVAQAHAGYDQLEAARTQPATKPPSAAKGA